VENPAVPSSGVLAWQPSCEGYHRDCFHPGMNRLPLSKARRGAAVAVSRGSASPAASFVAAEGCQRVFWICSHCDRGQCYCSPGCRTEARRRQCRAANRRHQQSPEGRLDHRDRQRAYRQRHAPPRVTDQGSLSVSSPAPFGCGEASRDARCPPAASDAVLRTRAAGRPVAVLRDLWAGQGRFVDPFPRIPRRR
jgi:hypothetical protein